MDSFSSIHIAPRYPSVFFFHKFVLYYIIASIKLIIGDGNFFTNLSDLENGIIIQACNGAHKQGILQFLLLKYIRRSNSSKLSTTKNLSYKVSYVITHSVL